MAALSVAVFLYAYKKLLDFKFSCFVASLSALTLTFAIPYHGIFAPSYNTASQVLWIIFILMFFEWKQGGVFWLSVLPMVMAFAHPTSAVIVATLVAVRIIYDRDGKKIANSLLRPLGKRIYCDPNFSLFCVNAGIRCIAFFSKWVIGVIHSLLASRIPANFSRTYFCHVCHLFIPFLSVP